MTAMGLAGLLLIAPAQAQNAQIIQQQNGFALPGVTAPSGHDEIRAADGTTCRSSVSNGGAYLDTGMITSGDGTQLSGYGRLIIPLARSRKRLDCNRLYELEVRRLELELQLAEEGMATGASKSSDLAAADWSSGDDWTSGDRR